MRGSYTTDLRFFCNSAKSSALRRSAIAANKRSSFMPKRLSACTMLRVCDGSKPFCQRKPSNVAWRTALPINSPNLA